jgi:hypothetical protein
MEAYFPTVLGLWDGLFDRMGLLGARPEQERTIPLHIHPQAASRIAELGLEPQVQAMLGYTRRIVRGLFALEVVYHGDEPDELGHFPYPMGLTSWVKPGAEQVLASVQCRFYAWRDWRFPRRVRRLFGFSIFYGEPQWLTRRE